MMKKTFLAFLSILMVISLITFSSCGKGQQEKVKVIKIGAILPLTGELSFFGQGDRKALELFSDKHKDVEFIFEDSKGSPKDGLNAVNKLISQDVKYFITSLSYIVNTIQPVIDKNKLLNITLNMDSRAEKNSRYCFRLYVAFTDEMDEFVSLVEKENVSKVAVLYVNIESTLNVVENYLRPKLESKKIDLITEKYNIGTKDFKNILLKLSTNNPEIVKIFDFGDKLGVILRQMEENKLFENIKIISGIETLLSDYKNFSPSVQQRFFFTAPKVLLDPNNVVVNEYHQKYNAMPTYDAMFAYDIANFLVPLIKKHDYDNIEYIVDEALKTKVYEGITSEFYIDENGGISPKIYWASLKDGKISFISEE